MTKFENVPYRRWSYDDVLVDCKEGKRVMALMAKVMKEGGAVDFRLNHPTNPLPTPGKVYDTINLTVMD